MTMIAAGHETTTYLIGNAIHAVMGDARSREIAAPTFSPDGLYFLGPRYEPHWGLPDSVAGFDWLPG